MDNACKHCGNRYGRHWAGCPFATVAERFTTPCLPCCECGGDHGCEDCPVYVDHGGGG